MIYFVLVFIMQVSCVCVCFFFFFQAEDGIRDLVRSRGLGDVYKRQCPDCHVPKEWGPKMIRKMQASNEVWHKLLGSVDTLSLIHI